MVLINIQKVKKNQDACQFSKQLMCNKTTHSLGTMFKKQKRYCEKLIVREVMLELTIPTKILQPIPQWNAPQKGTPNPNKHFCCFW